MWEGVPLFCRFIFYSSIALFILNLFPIFPITETLINIPILVYTRFHIWRIVTAPFVNFQIFTLLFGLCSYLPRGGQVEKMKGTSRFFIYFMTMSIIAMTMMVILDFILNIVLRLQWMSISIGLWSMVLTDMTVDSLKDPNLERPLCCFPIMIKSKYYPYIFLIIFGFLFMEGFLALL